MIKKSEPNNHPLGDSGYSKRLNKFPRGKKQAISTSRALRA